MSPGSAELLSAPSSRPEIGTAPSDRAEPCTVPVNWKVKGCQHQSAAGNGEEEREHPPPLLWLQRASFHKKCNSPLPPSLSGLFERARCGGSWFKVGLWGHFNLSCDAISCKVRCCIIFFFLLGSTKQCFLSVTDAEGRSLIHFKTFHLNEYTNNTGAPASEIWIKWPI